MTTVVPVRTGYDLDSFPVNDEHTTGVVRNITRQTYHHEASGTV
jgi:hypothetical protein